MTRTYTYEARIMTNEQRAEHKRMLARLRTQRYQQRHKDTTEWREHRLAIQRASYYRNQKKRLASKREQYKKATTRKEGSK